MMIISKEGKIQSIFLLALLLTTIFSINDKPAKGDEDNLIANGGFELGVTGWNATLQGFTAPYPPTLSTVSNIAHSGYHSCLLSTAKDEIGRKLRTSACALTYTWNGGTLTFWAKSDTPNATIEAYMDGLFMAPSIEKTFQLSSTWQQFELSKNTTTVLVSFWTQYSRVYLDDVVLTPLPTNIMINSITLLNPGPSHKISEGETIRVAFDIKYLNGTIFTGQDLANSTVYVDEWWDSGGKSVHMGLSPNEYDPSTRLWIFSYPLTNETYHSQRTACVAIRANGIIDKHGLNGPTILMSSDQFDIVNGGGGGGGGGGSGGGGGGGGADIPPTASFICGCKNPVTYSTVAFDAKNSSDADGSIAKYDWIFGDGSKNATSVPQISHVYSKVGDYQVILVVSDNFGLTTTTSKTIRVGRSNSTFQREYSSTRIRLGDFAIMKCTLVPNFSNVIVTLNFTSPLGVTKRVSTRTDLSGSYFVYFPMNVLGDWKISTSWVGSNDVSGSSAFDLVEVLRERDFRVN